MKEVFMELAWSKTSLLVVDSEEDVYGYDCMTLIIFNDETLCQI